MKQAVALLLIFQIFMGTTASSAPQTCESIFSSQDSWTFSVDELNSHLDPDLQIDLSKLNYLSRWIVNRSGKNLNPIVLAQTQNFEEAAYDFTNALKLARFLQGETRFSTKDWAMREELRRGLQATLPASNERPEKIREKLAVFLGKIRKYRTVWFALNPSTLPFMKDVPLSEELLDKMLIDGVNAHLPELEALAGKQDRVEFYRKVNTVYRVAFMTVTILYAIVQYQDMKEQIEKKKTAALFDGLDQLDAGLDALDQDLQKRGLYKN